MPDITDPKEINAIEDELQGMDVRTVPKLSEEERENHLGKYRKDPKLQVTMRLPEEVITGLQARAAEAGVPYQTFATMILSRYIHGGLLDKETFQAMFAGYPAFMNGQGEGISNTTAQASKEKKAS